MEGKYLITTENWFIAPDGQEYRSAWGEVSILSDGILGIKTNSRSANWYAKIGSEDNYVIIAGCQIFYAVKCENIPSATNSIMHNNEGNKYELPCKIYFAE